MYSFILCTKHLLNVKNYKYGDEAKCCYVNIAFAPPVTRNNLMNMLMGYSESLYGKLTKLDIFIRFP